MQETLTFPTIGSPRHRFTFSQSYFTDYSERCSPVSTPFVSAPSSPGRHCDGGFYFSAPTSPHWGHTFTGANEGMVRQYPSSIPLHWDEQPGTPRRKSSGKDEAGSFLMTSDFEFSARFTELADPSMSPTPMSSANELFCNGQIKPLRIPTTCTAHPASATSYNHTHGHATNYRMHMNEHATTSKGTSKHSADSGPFAFESSSRRGFAGSSSSSTSAPHSPRFCSTLLQSASSDLSSGKCTNSLSAPQSPRSPLNRVKGALCGVSPSRIDRAFDTSMHMAVRASQHDAEVSSSVNKALGTSMQMPAEHSNHPMEASKQAREGFRQSGRSVLSLAFRSHGQSHRRTRSFSPLKIFQRSDHLPSYSSSSIRAPAMEQENTHRLSQVTFTNENKPDEDSTFAQKGSIKKWTLKDLLHRKSGGDNRSNSRSSSRHSGASADSTSSIDKMCGKSSSAGRSSSESSQSTASAHTCTKDVITSMSTSSSRAKSQVRENMEQINHVSSYNKGLKSVMYDVRPQNHNSTCHVDSKLKSTCQRSIKAYVQKGTSKVPGMSSTEVQWSIHKDQSERGTACISNNGKAKSSTSQRGILTQKGNKGCISPHEMHYVMHKAQTEELRKRTFLPYRQGLLGCLGFNSRSYRTVSTISKTLQSVSG